ncbi:MAG: hypothetical protein KIT13_08600, partial [Burkholderiales bacterium]|nr:hypothetical protein [Burkholderiales bacterium]
LSIAAHHTMLTAFHATRPEIGDLSWARLKSPAPVAGDYATVRQDDSYSTAGLANAMTRVTGLQGTHISRDRLAFIADPAKYAGLALGGGFGANALMAGVMQPKP